MEKWRPWETASDADWGDGGRARGPDPHLGGRRKTYQRAAARGHARVGSLSEPALQTASPLSAAAPDFFTPSLEERTLCRCPTARSGTRRAFAVVHSGVLFDAGAALHGRFHAGSQTAFLRTADSCAALSNRTAPN